MRKTFLGFSLLILLSTQFPALASRTNAAMTSTQVSQAAVSAGAVNACYPFSYECVTKAPRSAKWPGHWVHAAFANLSGFRQFWLYLPSTYQKGLRPLPLMLMLHGCNQSAEEFAGASGMNEVAEKNGFAVLYPEQSSIDNGMRCWNWFLPINQFRNGGELSIVTDMIDTINIDVSLDRRRVYVTGLSAGGAMAANLAGCYSDLFAGAAIAAGLEFRAASNVSDGWNAGKGPKNNLKQTGLDAARCTGPSAKPINLMIIQGTQDQYINVLNAGRILTQFTIANDYLDDHAMNGSQTSSVIYHQAGQVPGGYPYTIDYFGGRDRSIHHARVLIQGMKHAWSGAIEAGTYADPKGPNASEMIWHYLSQFTR